MHISSGDIDRLRSLLIDIKDYYARCGFSTPGGPFTINKSVIGYLLHHCSPSDQQAVLQELATHHYVLVTEYETVTFSAEFLSSTSASSISKSESVIQD